MADEKKEGKGYFWQMTLAGFLGSLAAYALTRYAAKKNIRPEPYFDKTIDILKDVKSRIQNAAYRNQDN